MDYPDQASNDKVVLKDAPNEADAPLEEAILVGGPSNVDEIRWEARSRVVVAPMLPPRQTDTKLSRKRMPDWVLLGTYVPLEEWIHPPMSMVAPDP